MMAMMRTSTRSNSRVQAFVLLLVLVAVIGAATARIAEGYWEHCYSEEASDKLTVNYASADITVTQHGTSTPGIRVLIGAELHAPITQGRYQIELWHQESGLRVNYKGPYDVCCGFVSDSQCTRNQAGAIVLSDCPIEAELVASVTKPLARFEYGHYEATLTLFGTFEDGVEREIACIVLPAVFSEASWHNALHDHKLLTGELSSIDGGAGAGDLQEQLVEDIELPGEDHQKPITFKPEHQSEEQKQHQADSLSEPVLLLGS